MKNLLVALALLPALAVAQGVTAPRSAPVRTSSVSATGNITAGGNITATGTVTGAKVLAGTAGVVDSNLPIQLSTGGASTARFFAADKNAGYGMLFGYDNGSTVTGGVIRQVTTDPIYIYVNNTTQAGNINSAGKLTWAGALLCSTLAGSGSRSVVADASGNLSAPAVAPPEFSYALGSSLTAAADLGGYPLPASNGIQLSAIVFPVSGVGAGAGDMVVTASDGTNTCTATLACATTGSTGRYRVTTADGTGAGCTFPASANIDVTVTTACTTPPGSRAVTMIYTWR